MIGSLRNFAKTKIAGVFVFIIIIPFVFWGMGSMFTSGNTNNIAEVNNKKISTQDFMDFLNESRIQQETIKKNLDKNIIEELLSGLISTTLFDLLYSSPLSSNHLFPNFMVMGGMICDIISKLVISFFFLIADVSTLLNDMSKFIASRLSNFISDLLKITPVFGGAGKILTLANFPL